MAPIWCARLAVRDLASAEAAVAAFDGFLESVSVFTLDGDAGWHVEGLSSEKPDAIALEARLAIAAAGFHGSVSKLAIERLLETDWLAENQMAFPPLSVGRYFIHGGHWQGKPPVGRIALLIDATTAFGTGEHATTRGCLAALDGLARSGRRRRILDMGTGTGVLAIAAAKTWRSGIEARDIDAEAVRVARVNLRRNGVARFVSLHRSAGYRDRGLHRRRFELVLANILARPLIAMARDLRGVLADDGLAVLSGLLKRQERAVLAAHRRLGLVFRRRIIIDGWSTLVVAPRSSALPLLETNRREGS